MFHSGAQYYITLQGEVIGLFTSSVYCEQYEPKTSILRVLYACCISYFSLRRYIKSPFCLCERGGIEGEAREKKI